MRIIAHLDMDAFFAAVEERDRLRIRGLPIVVGADPKGGSGRGVVSTANYAARAYGIRSAIPISRAYALSEDARRRGLPAAVFIEPDFEKYSKASHALMRILSSRVPEAAAASIDEAYMDLSFCGSFPAAADFACDIKKEIFAALSLTASVGIGPNKLVAKIASDRKKPDGLTVVPEDAVLDFLAPLPVRTIPGVGPKTEEVLKKRGIATIADLRRVSARELFETFGKWGDDLYEKAIGRDDSPVCEEKEAKSIGEQETFEKDVAELGPLLIRIKSMCDRIARNAAAEGFSRIGRVTVTVRFADFVTKTRSRSFKEPLKNASELEFAAMQLLVPFCDSRENPRRKKIRLIGARAEKLS